MRSLIQRLLQHSDLAAAVIVVMVVVMMVVPLPTTLIDFAITINIAGALSILVATMYIERALDFASFPSLLLLTTLLRLGINVSVTRLVLLHADAGNVIRSFGHFVVGGNLVVGLVVFLILVVIQFVVITSGAGRVAEVAARFTLDAMPGKQMAIDADLNAGQITDDEARERRQEISREADFYGAMDGASKFVKGDAIAGVLIVVVNLIGGIAIGVVSHGYSFSQAAHTFSLLTVGDGLAAQIPALLISTATGILVTRSASKQELGREITYQILAQPRAALVAGTVITAMGLVPGLPKLPFFVVGGLLIVLSRTMKDEQAQEAKKREQTIKASKALEAANPSDTLPTDLAIDPLELTIGFGLVPLVDRSSGGSLLARVGVVRRQIAGELGLIVAPIRIHDDVALDSHDYVIKLRGVEVGHAHIIPGHLLAMDPGDAAPGLSGIPDSEPSFGLPAVWIDESSRAEAEALGYTVVDAESIIVTHLTETIRRYAAELLTRQETKKLLDSLKEQNAAAVDELIPDKLGVGDVQRVLQGLLREHVSIRDLGTILESISDRAMLTRDPLALTEAARHALGRAITAPYLEADATLRVIGLDPEFEQAVADSLTQTAEGEMLALDPSRAHAFLNALNEQIDRLLGVGRRPILLCSSRVRRHMRRLVEQSYPQLPVLAYSEVMPGVRVETAGLVSG